MAAKGANRKRSPRGVCEGQGAEGGITRLWLTGCQKKNLGNRQLKSCRTGCSDPHSHLYPPPTSQVRHKLLPASAAEQIGLKLALAERRPQEKGDHSFEFGMSRNGKVVRHAEGLKAFTSSTCGTRLKASNCNNEKGLNSLNGNEEWKESRVDVTYKVLVIHSRLFPYRTFPDTTFPHRTYPYRTFPYRTFPYRTFPHRTYPYRTFPYRTFPYRTAIPDSQVFEQLLKHMSASALRGPGKFLMSLW
jgi:hypothetical protein